MSIPIGLMETQLRKSLFLHHGHLDLYGDDGEMQCLKCPHGDYRRAPIDVLINQALDMAAKESRIDERSACFDIAMKHTHDETDAAVNIAQEIHLRGKINR